MQIEEVRAPSSEFRFCILHSAFCIRIAPVAQLPERDASNVGDAGESPAGSANFIYDLGFAIYGFKPLVFAERVGDSKHRPCARMDR